MGTDEIISENIADVDKIWIALGRLGRYQMKQLFVCFVCIWSYGFHVLSIVFIGYRPPYVCAEDTSNETSYMYNDSDTSSWKTYDTCSIKTHVNSSGVATVTETPCINGYDYGVDKDRTCVTEWDLVCDRSGYAELTQTLIMLGQATGAFIFTSLSDRFGRKPVTVGCHIALFLVTLGTASIPNFAGFAALRFLTGLFQEGVGLTNAILCLEMFPKEIRGYMEVFGLVFWTTGIALVTPIGYLFRNLSWRYLQIALACCSAWSLIHWWLIDESLRWLVANGKVEKAKIMIKKACKVNKKTYNEVVIASGFRDWERAHAFQKGKPDEQPLSDEPIKADLKMKDVHPTDSQNGLIKTSNEIDSLILEKPPQVKKYTVIDLVKSKRLFVTSLIMWVAWITNSLTYYGLMLISSTLAGNRFLNFFLGSIVEYPAAFLQYHSINRLGRKPTIIYFHAVCCIALITATVLTTSSNGSKAMAISSTVLVLIGKMAITGSFSTIFLTTPELYPTNMRTVGIGLTSTASRAGSMIAPFSRNLAEAVPWAPGLVYGILCAIVAVLALGIPETNNYELPQTLEECEVWYKENRFKLSCVKSRRKTRRESAGAGDDH